MSLLFSAYAQKEKRKTTYTAILQKNLPPGFPGSLPSSGAVNSLHRSQTMSDEKVRIAITGAGGRSRTTQSRLSREAWRATSSPLRQREAGSPAAEPSGWRISGSDLPFRVEPLKNVSSPCPEREDVLVFADGGFIFPRLVVSQPDAFLLYLPSYLCRVES